MLLIVLLHDNVTIKTFLKIIFFNNINTNCCLAGVKQCCNWYKFTKRSGIIAKCLEYYLAHMNTYYIQKSDHFGINCFARSKFCHIFYWIWQFYPQRHKQTVTSSWSRAISNLKISKIIQWEASTVNTP